MPDELTQAVRVLGREVHQLHVQMAADADERRSTREDQAILDHLLRESRRIARRLRALDAETP